MKIKSNEKHFTDLLKKRKNYSRRSPYLSSCFTFLVFPVMAGTLTRNGVSTSFISPSQQPFGIRTDVHCRVTESCQAHACISTHSRSRAGVQGRLCVLSLFYCCSPRHMLGKHHPPSRIPNLLDREMSWAVVIEF